MPGDAQDHPVCKAVLKAISPAKKGADLRSLFGGPPYGWPRDAVDTALVMLCNVGQVRAVGTDGKPATPAHLTATQLGTTVPFGQENDFLITIRDRLEQIAGEAGGDAPAPAAPSVPDANLLRGMIGNDLLAELALRADSLKKLIPTWQAGKAEKDRRLASFRLAGRLVGSGAAGQQTALAAIKAGRMLLDEPNPVVPLVSAAADDLRTKANHEFETWKAAWETGQSRLKADEAWGKISPEKKRDILAAHGLLARIASDLFTPDHIADSLSTCGISQWRDITLALPARVATTLQEAAVEIEPRTQSVAIPRRTLRSEPDLDAWLGDVRTAIAPCLAYGPVMPKSSSMTILSKPLRRQLETAIKQAREIAEAAANEAIERVGAAGAEAPAHASSDEQRLLRRRLRAHGHTLGDALDANGTMTTARLQDAAAYELWHRMLFGRFLAERGLLIHSDLGAAVSITELRELA